MKILYLECPMGIAGDMLMSAMLELIPDREDFIAKLNAAGIPKVEFIAEKAVKCGICGTHVRVLADKKEEGYGEQNHEYCKDSHKHSEHPHEHIKDESHANIGCFDENSEHIHEHTKDNHRHSEHIHEHSSMEQIQQIAQALQVPEKVKKDILAIYQIIAEAESKVHGKTVPEIHFHEVGTMDAIADITGCALLMNELSPDRIIASPITVGFGQVRCAHGILPVPAPAAANILKGIPCRAGNVRGELCTPTGAALAKYYVSEYGNMPPMIMECIGYGMGNKDFEAANCVRAIWGDAIDML